MCSDLDLAPAVGSESSVREQRIRGIHAASGSTAKLPKTNLDGLSVTTLKLICADRKLPTSGEDKDGKIFIDRILAGLPGKKPSSQLENRNVDGHADRKGKRGGWQGQDKARSDLKIASSPDSADTDLPEDGSSLQQELLQTISLARATRASVFAPKAEALKHDKESAHVLSDYEHPATDLI